MGLKTFGLMAVDWEERVDIERLRQVKYLVEQRGLNLAGVQLALELTRGLQVLREQVSGADRGCDDNLEPEITVLLRQLGHVDQEQLRNRGR